MENFKLACGVTAVVFTAVGVGKWIVKRLQTCEPDVYEQWLISMQDVPTSQRSTSDVMEGERRRSAYLENQLRTMEINNCELMRHSSRLEKELKMLRIENIIAQNEVAKQKDQEDEINRLKKELADAMSQTEVNRKKISLPSGPIRLPTKPVFLPSKPICLPSKQSSGPSKLICCARPNNFYPTE